MLETQWTTEPEQQISCFNELNCWGKRVQQRQDTQRPAKY
jgi:hypothetical protein